MKILKHGLRNVFLERPPELILWVLYLGAFSFGFRDKIPFWMCMTMTVLVVVAFFTWAYYYGKRTNEAFTRPSTAVITENSMLTMTIIRLEQDGIPRFQYSTNIFSGRFDSAKSDKTHLGAIVVSFENCTGAPILTDGSFSIERQHPYRLTWYLVKQESEYYAPWPEVMLPEGASGEITLNLLGRYGFLQKDHYRIVKTVQSAQGPITLAAHFTTE